jgi:D-lyxose ketol-isomerase
MRHDSARCANINEILPHISMILLKFIKPPINHNWKMELSHHYGIEHFYNFGSLNISVVNREYCKKIIVLLPGQTHPSHMHKNKEETFIQIYGDLKVNKDGIEHTLTTSSMLLIERGEYHSFSTESGAAFEEISTTHFPNDSFYLDEYINRNANRKSDITELLIQFIKNENVSE